MVILAVLVLVAAVTGCGRTPRYDGRLMAADSLMRTDPDSALAIVEGIDRDSLPDEGDRAYRDLLLTQARYRCYVTATSDSDINRALAYYRAHSGEQEKLTRAYIYKGAVMEELGHPDSAMLYYKHAEATAAPDDYFNLGYAKMRIAASYQDQLSSDSAAIIRLKQAIKCFEMENDTNYLISCYGKMGGMCGLKYPDSAEYYLKKAIKLAQLTKSTKQYTYKSKLAGLYFYHHKDYQHAKDIAMEVMRNGKDFSKERQFYYYAALSYVRIGMLDSAICVFEATPPPIDAVDSMNRYQAKAEIDMAKKDLIAYSMNLARSKDAEIQIRANKKDTEIKVAEIEFDRAQSELRKTQTVNNNHHLTAVLSITLIFILVLILLVLHLKGVTNKKKEEIKRIEILLSNSIQELEEKKQKLEHEQDSISVLVGYRILALNELFEGIKFKSKDVANNRIRRIISLSSLIIDFSETHQVLKPKLSNDFWNKMKLSVDAEYKGIATHIENNYPNLTRKEMQLFYLMCAKVPPQIIKLCLDYTNVKSIFNSINIIIKKKIGLDTNLDGFIDKYMKNDLQ